MTTSDRTRTRDPDSHPVKGGAWLSRALAGMVLAVSLAVPAVSPADQQDPRLGEFFTALADAPGTGQALTIEAAIWTIWLDGEATVSQRLDGAGNRRHECAPVP